MNGNFLSICQEYSRENELLTQEKTLRQKNHKLLL